MSEYINIKDANGNIVVLGQDDAYEQILEQGGTLLGMTIDEILTLKSSAEVQCTSFYEPEKMEALLAVMYGTRADNLLSGRAPDGMESYLQRGQPIRSRQVKKWLKQLKKLIDDNS